MSRVGATNEGHVEVGSVRRFVELTGRALEELLAADLSALDIVAVFVDGFSPGDHRSVSPDQVGQLHAR